MSGPHSSEDLLALLELGEAPAGHVLQEPSAGVGTEQPKGQVLQEPSAGVGTEQTQWGGPVYPSDLNAELKAETGIPSPMYDETEDDKTTSACGSAFVIVKAADDSPALTMAQLGGSLSKCLDELDTRLRGSSHELRMERSVFIRARVRRIVSPGVTK